MSNNNYRDPKGVPFFHLVISTGLGMGYFPVAPGTAGAFLALLIWVGLYFVLSPMALFIANIVLVVGSLFIGVWTDNVMERYWGEDPRTVVIDEFFGTWMATLAATFVVGESYVAISLATLGFALFRLIDITKPLGCRWVDRHIHGGWGCMLDDALAGFYALLLTLVVRYLHVVEWVRDAVWG